VRNDVISVLTEKSHGLYVLLKWLLARTDEIYSFSRVECQITGLIKCRRRVDVNNKLAYLPQTLDETYKLIFLGIPSEHSKSVTRLFTLVIYAKQPLPIQEPIEAIILNPSFNEVDPELCFLIPEEIAELCASLVETRAMKTSLQCRPTLRTMLRLAHYSVQEYPCSDKIRCKLSVSMFGPLLGDRHSYTLDICMSYWQYTAFVYQN